MGSLRGLSGLPPKDREELVGLGEGGSRREACEVQPEGWLIQVVYVLPRQVLKGSAFVVARPALACREGAKG